MKYSIPLFSCASSLAMVGFLKHSRQVVEPTIFTLFCSKFELNISTHTNRTSQTLCFVCGTCMNTVEVISQSKMLDGTLLLQSFLSFSFDLRKLNCPFCAWWFIISYNHGNKHGFFFFVREHDHNWAAKWTCSWPSFFELQMIVIST